MPGIATNAAIWSLAISRDKWKGSLVFRISQRQHEWVAANVGGSHGPCGEPVASRKGLHDYRWPGMIASQSPRGGGRDDHPAIQLSKEPR